MCGHDPSRTPTVHINKKNSSIDVCEKGQGAPLGESIRKLRTEEPNQGVAGKGSRLD